MKITRFEVIPLKQRGLLLKVHTDSELVGYGSPMNYEHGRTVVRAIHDMEDYLVGRDPRSRGTGNRRRRGLPPGRQSGPGLGIDISEAGLAANTATEWRLRNMRRDPEDHSYSDI